MNEAALAYTRYVLEVRDSLQICNGQLEAIKTYVQEMEGVANGP